MSELYKKRIRFTAHLAQLIDFIGRQAGYTVALAPDGLKHMPHSLHYLGLAADLNIYRDGVYLRETADYQFAGYFWHSLDEDCVWGGDFGDGNHFSISFGGRK